ncbi:uncharacterized protein LOC117903356 [Drosophila subobscura]|uniref:uncharacterized protein LOC117903356 n=1 Tax=Drosophila subobscura TaxID=7241 RepID=UPI00155B38A3|nr:uncharacterized protein LOC117903356 [Drosophila subobscura]XP_034671201.1 uncharacterized protein LOC117903356 [Drosophila subobscura]
MVISSNTSSHRPMPLCLPNPLPLRLSPPRLSPLQLFKCLCLVSLLLPLACGDWLMDCGNCHCKWNSGKKTADCRNLSLSGVPEYLSSEVQVLDLSQNQILSLEENAFLATQLQNLHKLFIRNSTLQRIIPQSFKQLEILIELDLSNNLLRELPPNVFDCLTKVRALVLNGNLLQTLRGGVFHHLKYLHKIELKHNRLVSIDVEAFQGVPLLSQIYLDGNQFRVLHRETFQSLTRLTALSLDQNPWNCTCDLQEFRDFVLKMNLYTPPTACRYPLALRSMLWIEDQPEAFACKPKIVYPSRGASINTSKENVTLVCRVHGSPNTVVAWDYNKQLYKSGTTSRVHIEMLREDTRRSTRDPHFGRDIFTSRLTIVGAEKSDEGVYTCLAENAGGKDAVQMSLIVQPTVQRDLLLNSNIFVIICLMVLGLLSISVLLSMVTYCIYRRFKHLQLQPTQLRFSAQQFSASDAGEVLSGMNGVTNSIVVAGGTEMLLNTFHNPRHNQGQAATDRRQLEVIPTDGTKFADLITSIDRGRSPHAIMGYLCSQHSTVMAGGGTTGSREAAEDQTLSLERKLKDKLHVASRLMPVAAVRETAIIRPCEDYQPDVLPTNSPTGGHTEHTEDQLSQQLMLIGLNSRSKYNISVQKYLQEKYGTAVRKNNNNICDRDRDRASDRERDSDSCQLTAAGSLLPYPPKVSQEESEAQPQPQSQSMSQSQSQLLQRHCQSLALPSSQRHQPTDSQCRQPSPPPYSRSRSNTTQNTTTTSNATTNQSATTVSVGGVGGVMDNMIAAITVTTSSSSMQQKLNPQAATSASRQSIL